MTPSTSPTRIPSSRSAGAPRRDASREAIRPGAVIPGLIVGPSLIHGRGVFATRNLPARRKLGEITGNLVRWRPAVRAVAHAPEIYLVELGRGWALRCDGNAFMHLNHSCRPNGYLRIIRRRVEVYALRAIAAGEELTVDYGQTPHAGGMACACGHPDCRRRL